MTRSIALFLALSSIACVLPKMAVRPELAVGEQMPFERPVFDGGGKLRFGAFTLGSFDRSSIDESREWSRSDFFPEWIKGMGELSAKQDFSFMLLDGGTPVRTVRCRAALAKRSTKLAGAATMSDAQQSLRCAFFDSAGNGELGRLSLNDESGSLHAGAHTVTIQARDLNGNPTRLVPAGYGLREGDLDLAAVMTVNGGSAWIAPTLDRDSRTLVAAASAALLVYRPLGGQ